jgi:hypothetical protein
VSSKNKTWRGRKKTEFTQQNYSWIPACKLTEYLLFHCCLFDLFSSSGNWSITRATFSWGNCSTSYFVQHGFRISGICRLFFVHKDQDKFFAMYSPLQRLNQVFMFMMTLLAVQAVIANLLALLQPVEPSVNIAFNNILVYPFFKILFSNLPTSKCCNSNHFVTIL